MDRPEYELLSRLRTGNKAAPVRGGTKIPVIEEETATGDTAAAYQYFRDQTGRQDVPGILKCFATSPAFAQNMVDISSSLLFCEGALTRRQKELIATWVSHLNACPYCFDSHGFFLTVLGADRQMVAEIAESNLTGFSEAERELLTYLGKVEQASYKTTREDVERLRELGWSYPQIAEAVHVAAMMGFCNRVANAFGLPPQNLLSL